MRCWMSASSKSDSEYSSLRLRNSRTNGSLDGLFGRYNVAGFGVLRFPQHDSFIL